MIKGWLGVIDIMGLIDLMGLMDFIGLMDLIAYRPYNHHPLKTKKR